MSHNFNRSLNSDCEKLLVTKDAARMLGVSYRTLEDWRITGCGPAFAKLGRRVLYRTSDLFAFVAARMSNNTGQSPEPA